MKKLILAGLAGLLAASAAQASVVSDDFEAGTPNGLGYYRVGATSQSIGGDTTLGPAGNNALIVTNNTTFQRILRTGFGTVSLSNPGETITLSFDFRITGTVPNASNDFRFGLYNSDGTPVAADNQSTNILNDWGYGVQLGLNNASNNFIRENADTASGAGGGAGTDIVTGFSTGTPKITDNSAHHIDFTLTYNAANSVTLSLALDGDAVGSWTDTHGLNASGGAGANSTYFPSYSFDEILFGLGGTTASYNLDNVTLSIPEPISAAGLSLGLLTLTARRRRR